MNDNSSQTKFKLSWKDGITIILFFIAVMGYLNLSGRITRQALLEDQVNRNKTVLDTYNIPVLSYKMDEMDKKLDKILETIGQ